MEMSWRINSIRYMFKVVFNFRIEKWNVKWGLINRGIYFVLY